MEFLVAVLKIFIIFLVIGFTWRRAELYLYKEVTPKVLDDVIAIILSISLYFNFY